jgi:hypothetical protein
VGGVKGDDRAIRRCEAKLESPDFPLLSGMTKKVPKRATRKSVQSSSTELMSLQLLLFSPLLLFFCPDCFQLHAVVDAGCHPFPFNPCDRLFFDC